MNFKGRTMNGQANPNAETCDCGFNSQSWAHRRTCASLGGSLPQPTNHVQDFKGKLKKPKRQSISTNKHKGH